MFKHFPARPRVLAPAGFPFDEPPTAHRFRHGGRGRGRKFVEDLFDFGDEREPRARRGDIKFLLLELLSEGPAHGYDLMKRAEARTGGFRRLSPGSVYPTLQMLEDGGFVSGETSEGKRVYTLTDEGRQLLAGRTAGESAGESPSDTRQELPELRRAATELAGAILQVAREGNRERTNRVRELLERTKREIYAILAGE